NGVDENPDAPHALTVDEPPKPQTVVVTVEQKKKEYPIELAQRPIKLAENLTEIGISPHFQVSPFAESDAIHARYGITDQWQVGVTYVYGGVWKNSLVDSSLSNSYGFHSGKAFGFDVTYLIENWIGVTAGIPFYVSPFAL